ncbi:uracil-DNA glycosylase family protein [Erythrobacter ani]|uniref:Uracil-DNA glycosylase-like domain-containing protein n=1 Tax=Erythrobacter ani TaxID=2827235 RepID=A0ABS6SPH3_9SPHN|nr:uracil-DNA glycosylase family protein [Erythrobacter ani]MBV7266935.1 hypothetical protein [Erythrobacter ani]
MDTSPPSFARDLAAAMDWWRDAGVDHDFSDDVTVWLDDADQAPAKSKPEPAQASDSERDRAQNTEKDGAASHPASRADLIGESPPATLEDFRKFWLEAPGLDGVGPRGRIVPRGPAEADLMILVVDPEETDRTSLLSGPQGQLLSNMLTAMGAEEENTYVASALPRHTPMADTAAIAGTGMDAVTALHIQLAAPKRVIALGKDILPLIGHDRAQDITSLRKINHETANMPLMVSEGLDNMMSMPRLKARFWRRWIEWSATW